MEIAGDDDVLDADEGTAFVDQLAATDAEASEEMHRAVSQLVHVTSRLPRDHPREHWAWLVADLVTMWKLTLRMVATGGKATMLVFVATEPSESIQGEFQKGPDESTDAARQRLKQWYRETD